MQDGAPFPSRQLRECSVLFRELVDYMNPLLTLIDSGSCDGDEYALIIPPNSDIERCVTRFCMQSRGGKQRIIRRVPQSVVRRHLLHGRSLADMSNLAGDTVRVDLRRSSNSGNSTSEVSLLGYITLQHAGGAVRRVGIQWREPYGANNRFSVLFVDGALLDDELVASVKVPAMHSGVHNHVWSRLHKPTTTNETPAFEQYKGDENALRSFLEEIVNRKSEENDNSKRLRKQLDEALLYVETEVGIMLLSYVCMPGYEQLIVAKVHQIVTTGADAATSDCCFSEEDREDILVSFHTIVSGALSRKLVPHWDNMMQRENIAFNHACRTLKQAYPFRHFLPRSLPLVPESCFASAIRLVRLLESDSLSALSLMRVMEGALNTLMDALAAHDCSANSTADVCISLAVALVVAAEPVLLPARIRYITDFGLVAMEMSAAGYAVTTFEAASTQIMEEYRLHISAV
ncbi:hypothetical protein DQ04_02641040 [Trypanosoma grayi]|uniref:hypothetical protein n=1 Tax=Trypanosoma grayi TaxID=71804 RepID=UPI0004F48AE9|nr:hypothetical protein DQ04_02641040 [Trypanosoma grayi]KEG11417.1 hypothetical protein DQ04_02641040 [Trypanosoma grayi]